MGDASLSEQYGSDIDSYPDIDAPGTGERIADGIKMAGEIYGIADEISSVVSGDTSLGDAAGSISGDLAMLALDATLAIKDPIYALAEAGLSILLELVSPLNDVLHWVSGDPGQMAQQQEVWGQVEEALGALGEEVGTTVSSALPSWSGQAAESAFSELYGFSAAIGAMSHEAGGIKQLLAWAELLAQTIYDVIKAILSELVAWLITRGLVALAASSFTFGAAFAEFLLSASLKGVRMINTALSKFKQAQGIFGKIVNLALNFFVPAGKPLWKAVLFRGLITAGVSGGIGAATTGLGQLTSGQAETGLISAGSPTGLSVDIDGLDALASGLDGLSGNGESIHSVASQAASEDMTWGLTGLFFASSYNDSCQEATTATAQLSPACSGHAQRVRDCKDAYTDADEVAVSDFESRYNEM